MNISTHLDVDLVAVESTDRVSLMVDITAPTSDAQKVRPGQGIEIVLDRSGSMSGQSLESAKESIIKLIDRLAPQDSFGLVSFDDTALIEVPFRTLAQHDLLIVKNIIANLNPGGSTDLAAGYLLGLRELKDHKKDGGAALILISDGHANAGEQNPKVLGDIATKASKSAIVTTTIGLGNGYDETLLEALSAGGGGSHRFAYTSDEAIAVISSEVSNLLEKSAINMLLKVTPVAGLNASPHIEILQRLPFWQESGTYFVQLGDMYAGENRRFMIDFEVPQIASLGLATIANIVIDYTNLVNMTEVSVTLPVQVNVVPDDIAKGRVIDPVIRAERLVLKAQSEKLLATEEIRSGKVKEAADRLNKTANNLRHEVASFDISDARVKSTVDSVNTEADEMDRLAKYAVEEDAQYSAKRNLESFSRSSRSKNFRDENS